MNASQGEVAKRLIDIGKRTLADARPGVRVVHGTDSETLINDLDEHPHAYVIGCVMDMQIPAERAFGIPLELSRRLGFFDMPNLARLSREQCREAMLRPTPLHRFEYMGDRLHSAIQRIHDVYGDVASRIWAGAPSSATIERRFHDFDGAGPKIASMATNILARSFSIPMSDRSGIDISVDSHLLRVFPRLGFAEEGADAETLRSAARALNPEYPGIFDIALWDLGRTVCGPRHPDCSVCELRDVCPTGTGVRSVQPTVSAPTPRPTPRPPAAARTGPQPSHTKTSATPPRPASTAPVAGSFEDAPVQLRSALLSPRHVGKTLDADEGLRKAFYALYELCMSLSDDVQMTDNKTHLHFKRFNGSSRLFAKVKIRPRPGKMNVSIWSGAPIPLGFARDVRQLDTPDEDYELEIGSVFQVAQARPYIMESFRSA
jgi:endonuclease III